MSGKRSGSLNRWIGIVIAGLAVVLLVLDRTTGLAIPYGYDASGFRFWIGAAVAILVLLIAGWRYRDTLFG